MRPAESPLRLILAADLHLREDCPACREPGEFFKAQEAKLAFISETCRTSEAMLIVAGDIFDHWKPSPWLITLALKYLPPGTVAVPGQHDLPGHNLQELAKTGLNTLQEAGRVFTLTRGFERVLRDSRPCFGAIKGYGYGETPENAPAGAKIPQILVWHRLVCPGPQPWPGAGAEVGSKLFRRLDRYDLIVTGDNHQQFVVRLGGKRLLVNPGSMMRTATDQMDHEPAVFLWEGDGTLARIVLPIDPKVVKDAGAGQSKAKESRDRRMEAYIERAAKQYEDRLSFEKNLERYFNEHKESPGVKNKVWEAVGEFK